MIENYYLCRIKINTNKYIFMSKLFSIAFMLLFFGFSNAQESAPEANTDGTLTVSASVAYNSPYYYAVWIKNPAGTFLRTLTMYGNTSKYYADLTHWNTESAANKVNATTGATKSSSGSYNSTWNGKDQSNTNIVPDGTFTVSIELSSESYGTNSKYITKTFTKGAAAQTVTATNVSPISNISIKWVPNNTAIDEVKASQYKCYPNPTKSSVYITGFDIQSVELLTLNGKSIFTTNEQKLNLSGLPKGIYLAKLNTSDGTFIKKIEKQ